MRVPTNHDVELASGFADQPARTEAMFSLSFLHLPGQGSIFWPGRAKSTWVPFVEAKHFHCLLYLTVTLRPHQLTPTPISRLCRKLRAKRK